MTTLPFVSICLLTYNRASVIGRSVDSLLAQTHQDFELIINDNCSSDNTEFICRQFEKMDARVRYCRNPANLGYAGNQNSAISRARSNYVALVHDGDVYRPDLLEQWTTALVRHSSAALVFNALGTLDDSGKPAPRVHSHSYPPLIPGRQLFDEMLTRSSSPIFGIAMVRKTYVESVGLFDTRFPVLADVDMWLRLLLRYDAAYIAEPLLHIAPHEANHVCGGVNWSILEENERIHRTNAERRYHDDPTGLEKAHRVLDRVFLRCRLRALVSCLKPHRWGKISAGIRSVLAGRATA